VDVDGLAVTLVDTAGLRDAADEIEAEGVRRAHGSVEAAHVALVVLDGSEPLQDADRALLDRTVPRARVIVVNKSDRPPAWDAATVLRGVSPVRVSATTGDGLDALKTALVTAAGGDRVRETPALTNIRHLALLERAASALARGKGAAAVRAHEELVLVDLHDAKAALEEVTGQRSTDDLLNEIFGRFCIGK
jgi:tRNA modification GTPase